MNLRQQYQRVNWDNFDADRRAIESGQTRADQLPADRRENLQRGNDVVAQYSAYDQVYKSAHVVQRVELNDLKEFHSEVIKDRDQAALVGRFASAGLGVLNSAEALANAAVAAKIPVAAQLGYAYISGLGIGGKINSAASNIDSALGGSGSAAVNRAMDNAVNSVSGGDRNPGLMTAPPSGSNAPQQNGSAGSATDGARKANNLVQGIRDGQSALTGIVGMRDDFGRADTRMRTTGDVNNNSNEPALRIDPNRMVRNTELAFQAGQNTGHAIDEVRQGNYGAATDSGLQAFKNGAELYGRGQNVEEIIQAKASLEKAMNANSRSEQLQYMTEYMGHGTQAADGFIPGAANAGQALMSSGQVIQNVREYNEFVDMGNRDNMQSGVDRFEALYNRDDAMLNRLNRYYQSPRNEIQLR